MRLQCLDLTVPFTHTHRMWETAACFVLVSFRSSMYRREYISSPYSLWPPSEKVVSSRNGVCESEPKTFLNLLLLPVN